MSKLEDSSSAITMYSRIVVVLSSGLLTPLTLYYLGIPFPIIVSWHRASFTVFSVMPLLGNTLIDTLILILSSITLIVYSVRDLLGKTIFSLSIIMLALTGFLLYTLTSKPIYLLLLGLAGLIGLGFSLYFGRRQIILKGIAYSVITISCIVSLLMLMFFLGILNENIAYGVVLYWRSIWRIIEWFSIYLMIIIGLYWLIMLLLRRSGHLNYLNIEFEANMVGRSSYRFINNLILFISILLPGLFVLLLHLPSFNPSFAPISVDTFFYARALTKSHSLNEAITQFSGTRPLYMVIIYIAYRVVKDPIILMDILHPAIVLGLLVYASYRLVKRYHGENLAILAAILTALGPNTLTFIAGGFQANSLALALILLAWSLDKQMLMRFILYLLVAFIHPWTFTMYMVAEFLYRWWKKESMTSTLAPIMLLAFLSVILSSIEPSILGSSRMSEYVYALVLRNIKIMFPIGTSISQAIEIMTWGSLLNPFIYSLIIASYPVLTIAHTVIAISAPATFIVTKTIAHRLLLNVPFGVLAAYGLVGKSRYVKTMIVMACLAQALTIMPAFTPLTSPPWTNIFNPNT